MTLEDLGYHQEFEDYRQEQSLDAFGIARVVAEHKDRYTVKTVSGELDAELLGNLRYSSESRLDLPAVGDWVSISEYDDDKALIHAVFPRRSILERKAVGKLGQTQIIATNIDVGLIVQSVNRDFSINRLERYLTICHASKVEPIIVLSKVDLVEQDQLEELLNQIRDRIKGVSIHAISNQTQFGIEEIKTVLQKGKTYCLLGSSGVGKSTLINTLAGRELTETGEISQSIDRGKHVTTRRELIVLEQGILIDNPGMREVGMTGVSEGLEITFDQLQNLAKDCRYSDCSHTSETGCAVLEAVERGELDADSYDNFMKMEKEKTHYESNAQERKKKDKDLGKLIRRVKKHQKNNGF